MNLKISYLITCCNETDTLIRLLSKIHIYTPKEDQIVVVWDSVNGKKQTREIIDDFHKHVYENKSRDFLTVKTIPFNDDYAEHKNLVIKLANDMSNDKKADFFFQIDGDELPSDTLIFNIREIIESNKNVELIYVPRINDYKGVTKEHAKQWGWKLSKSEKIYEDIFNINLDEYYKYLKDNNCIESEKWNGIIQSVPVSYRKLLVQWPDYQGRIFKNDFPRIRWERKLHEKIEGHKEYAFLPPDEELAIYHDKTIEKQIQTNLSYNKQFTVEDNMGHKIV